MFIKGSSSEIVPDRRNLEPMLGLQEGVVCAKNCIQTQKNPRQKKEQLKVGGGVHTYPMLLP